MARPLRIEFPGALYHVTSRGNARAAIYADDTDRTIFLALLAPACSATPTAPPWKRCLVTTGP